MKKCIKVVMSLLIGVPIFAQWESDVRLTDDPDTSRTSYNNAWCVAVSLDTVHVVWYDHRDGNDEIYYKRSTDNGTTWGSDTRLTYDDSVSCYPSIAVSDSNLHVVWADYQLGDWEIYYREFSGTSEAWGQATRLTSDTSNSYYPSIAVSDSNIHVVWADDRDDNLEIYYKRSTDNGATWEPDTRLTTDNFDSQFPCIAVSGSNVHVVWLDYRDGNPEIYYKQSTDNGTNWVFDIRLTNDIYESWYPSIAVSGANLHVVWPDMRDGNSEIYYKRSLDYGANWESDTRLTIDNSVSFSPSIAVSDSNVHVVWRKGPNGATDIYYKNSLDNGTNWETDENLTWVTNYYFSYSPSIAVSGSNLHVVWFDDRDDNQEIYYKRNLMSTTGVKEKLRENQKSKTSLKVKSNPFVSFTQILGYEKDYFVLYDVTGKRVGIYQGNRIGEDLVGGVYFLKTLNPNLTPLQIVKLR